MEGYTYIDSYRLELANAFFIESFMIIELIVVIIAIFSATLLQSKANHFLIVYTTHSKKGKLQFIFSKITLGLFIIAMLIIIDMLTFYLIVNYFTPYQIDVLLINKLFVYLFLEASQLFCLTLMVSIIINHIFASIIPLVLFWYLESINLNITKFKQVFNCLFININPLNPKDVILIYPIITSIIIITIYIFINYMKDCC
ncbi:MAG: hypothetical protein K9L64_00385 [Candidatus Izimaplasma sp.]|nr:hypothetical protein [Candidatus Izimaplasma bacterium]